MNFNKEYLQFRGEWPIWHLSVLIQFLENKQFGFTALWKSRRATEKDTRETFQHCLGFRSYFRNLFVTELEGKRSQGSEPYGCIWALWVPGCMQEVVDKIVEYEGFFYIFYSHIVFVWSEGRRKAKDGKWAGSLVFSSLRDDETEKGEKRIRWREK